MGAIDNIKEFVGLVQKLDNIELLKRTLELQNEVMALTDENHRLKAEIAAARDAASRGSTLSFRAPLYYAPDDATPFCPRCWEVDRRTVHLHGPFRVTGLRWDCPQCNQTYLIQTDEERNAGPFRPRSRSRFR